MARNLKVGLFVLAGIVLVFGIVFLIGDSRNMWESKVKFRASFGDVAGMKPGSPVRMGGVDIGEVSSVGHSENPKDHRITVVFNVVKSESVRIRRGVPGPDGKIVHATTARVAAKGFLGDKMLELTTDGEGESVPPDSVVPSEEAGDALAQIQQLGKRAETVLKNLEEGTRPLADPQLAEDLKAGAHDLRIVLDGLARTDSIAHRMIANPKDGENFSASMENLRIVSNNMRDYTARMNTGPGLAHTLVYDPETAGSAAGALSEVHRDLKAIREGNVNAMSDDLRAIVGDMRKGKGTLGALLVDPSLYEDLKGLIGNTERNQVLRALVRSAIQADEGRPKK